MFIIAIESRAKRTMLLHIRPQLLLAHPTAPVTLVDLRAEPVGLLLRDGVELATRCPYPNKRYYVGCRRIGRAAVDGLLIETSRRVMGWSYVARWALGAERVVTHRVTVELLDNECDAATDSMMLWPRGRIPPHLKGVPPIKAEPKMRDDAAGGELAEIFRIPTMDRATLLAGREDWRPPRAADAFQAAPL